MHTSEIPSEQWLSFINNFSRDHLDWPASLEILDPTLGDHSLAENLPLQGLSFDTKGTRPASLEVALGDAPNAPHISHTIEHPLHIYVADDPQHHAGTIEIEPAQGPKVLLHYHAPAA